MKKVVYVDVDGVCANLGKAWIGIYNRLWNDDLDYRSVKSWGVHQYVKPECGFKVYDILEMPALYDEVEPIPGAFEGVENLKHAGDYRVVFATSSVNRSAGVKLRWLVKHHFLEWGERETLSRDYIEIHDKSLLRGFALIDDGPHNVSGFAGIGLLYKDYHNVDFHNNNPHYPYIDWSNDIIGILEDLSRFKWELN